MRTCAVIMQVNSIDDVGAISFKRTPQSGGLDPDLAVKFYASYSLLDIVTEMHDTN